MRNRRQMEYGIAFDAAVIAKEFAIRAFRFDMAGGVQITFQNVLRIGRHHQIVGDALDHAQRCAAQRRHQLQFIGRHAHGGGNVIDGMGADGEGDRQAFAACRMFQINRAQIGGRDQVDAGGTAAAQHQAAHADIGQAVGGVYREIDRR
jgi:hypothetical protein